MARIRKRGNSYQIDYFDPSGKRIRKSFSKKKDAEAELGKTYLGKVKRVVDFGAFVEILPGTEGLLHISQISERRIAKVTDELHEGDEVLVKVIEVDKSGRIRLSRKEALRERRPAKKTGE